MRFQIVSMVSLFVLISGCGASDESIDPALEGKADYLPETQILEKGIDLNPTDRARSSVLDCPDQGCTINFEVCLSVFKDGTTSGEQIAEVTLEGELVAAWSSDDDACQSVSYQGKHWYLGRPVQGQYLTAKAQKNSVVQLTFHDYEMVPNPVCDPGQLEINEDPIYLNSNSLDIDERTTALFQEAMDHPFEPGDRMTFTGLRQLYPHHVQKLEFRLEADSFFSKPEISIMLRNVPGVFDVSLEYRCASGAAGEAQDKPYSCGGDSTSGYMNGKGGLDFSCVAKDNEQQAVVSIIPDCKGGDESGAATILIISADWRVPEQCQDFELEVAVQ